MYKLQEVLLLLSEEKILGIIKAVRENPFLDRFENELNHRPSLQVELTQDNKIELRSIRFVDYDEIIITPLGITFVPYYESLSPRKTDHILVSTDWEDLCQKLNVN